MDPAEVTLESCFSRSHGLGMGAAASALLGTMAFLVHESSNSLPSNQLMFARGCLGSLWLIPLLRARPRRWAWSPWLVGRCAFAGVSILCFAYNLKHVDVGVAEILFAQSTAFTLLLSKRTLGEVPTRLEFLGSGLLIASIFVLFSTETSKISPHVLVVGLLGASSAACANLALRKVARSHSPGAVVGAFSLTLAGLSWMLPGPDWHVPSGTEWGWLLAIAGCGVAGHLAMALAFRGLTAVKGNLLLLFSAVIGVLLDVLFGDATASLDEVKAFGLALLGLLAARTFHPSQSPDETGHSRRRSGGREAGRHTGDGGRPCNARDASERFVE